MTDESHHWGASDTAPYGGAADHATPGGWYPDPWSHGQHRYWDGTAWTSGTFPNGPATAGSPEGADAAPIGAPAFPATAPFLGAPAVSESLPPPAWTSPTHQAWDPAAAVAAPGPAPDNGDLASKPSRLPTGLGFVALIVAVMLVVGALGTLGGYLVFRHHTSTPAAAGTQPGAVPTLPPFSIPGPTPSTPSTLPADPAASSLASLVITQADVPSTIVVQAIDGGDQVSAANGTLDLCNSDFASETLRTARLQVSAYDGVGNSLLSTEAVLYRSPAASEQAFSELKAAAAVCPPTPVVSPIGEPTATTHFNAAPDAGWPQTATVTRLAYDFTSTTSTASTHYVTVYLRRGRALIGVYFHVPDAPQISVAGQTTIEAIAGVFAGRLAQLPASVVNG